MSHHHTVGNMVVINNCCEQKNHGVVMVMVVSCCVFLLSQFFSSVTSPRHSSIIWEGMKWKKHLFSIVCDSVPSRRNTYLFPVSFHYLCHVLFNVCFPSISWLLILACLPAWIFMVEREREKLDSFHDEGKSGKTSSPHSHSRSESTGITFIYLNIFSSSPHTLRNFRISTTKAQNLIYALKKSCLKIFFEV